jgi:type IV pilus assembly protein PilW
MVALVVSAILLSGVVKLYAGTKASYRTSESISRIQENARFVLDLMTRDIRQAGFQGCTANIDVNIISSAPVAQNINTGAAGFEYSGGNWTPNLPAPISGNAVIGDVFMVTSAASTGVNVASLSPPNANVQVVHNNIGILKNDMVFVTDCQTADLFTVTNTPGTNGNQITLAHANGTNITNRLSKEYDTDATVMRFVSTSYFIGLNNNVRTLFRSVNSGNPQPLVEGIEDMQVLYGINATAPRPTTIEQYVSADNIGTANVLAIRIALLVTGNEEVALETRPYQATEIFSGSGLFPDTHGTQDRKLRREFVSTITLRNHAL